MSSFEAWEVAGYYDDKLLATDPRFDRKVFIIHQDGSTLMFERAFLMKKEEWIFLFTEHHSFCTYHQDDLVSFHQFDKTIIPVEELP